MSDILRQTRKGIKDTGTAPNEDLAGGAYFKNLQDIRRRMNAAITTAIIEAEKPFLTELEEAEEDYAMFLKMAS